MLVFMHLASGLSYEFRKRKGKEEVTLVSFISMLVHMHFGGVKVMRRRRREDVWCIFRHFCTVPSSGRNGPGLVSADRSARHYGQAEGGGPSAVSTSCLGKVCILPTNSCVEPG